MLKKTAILAEAGFPLVLLCNWQLWPETISDGGEFLLEYEVCDHLTLISLTPKEIFAWFYWPYTRLHGVAPSCFCRILYCSITARSFVFKRNIFKKRQRTPGKRAAPRISVARQLIEKGKHNKFILLQVLFVLLFFFKYTTLSSCELEDQSCFAEPLCPHPRRPGSPRPPVR